MGSYLVPLSNLGMDDIESVGGKNASLGEMISQLSKLGVRVPGGYATTADAYRDFMTSNGLGQRISSAVNEIDVDDVEELARVGAEIRGWIRSYVRQTAQVGRVRRAG